mmetsp:Transcript_73231/g.136855  ORF Transcript_73231/g.136855 Transcript_73231/m.136855 type:complete len:511 (-) Transcript_73231:76-1608(-)
MGKAASTANGGSSWDYQCQGNSRECVAAYTPCVSVDPRQPTIEVEATIRVEAQVPAVVQVSQQSSSAGGRKDLVHDAPPPQETFGSGVLQWEDTEEPQDGEAGFASSGGADISRENLQSPSQETLGVAGGARWARTVSKGQSAGGRKRPSVKSNEGFNQAADAGFSKGSSPAAGVLTLLVDSPESPHQRVTPSGTARPRSVSAISTTPRADGDLPTKADSANISIAGSVTEDFMSEAWDVSMPRVYADASSRGLPVASEESSGWTASNSDGGSIADLEIDWDPAKAEFPVNLEEGHSGLRLLRLSDSLLIVTGIDSKGTVAKWNAAGNEKQVLVGDALVSAEGCKGYENDHLEEVLQGPVSKTPRNLTFRHDAFDLSLARDMHAEQKQHLGVEFEEFDDGRLLRVTEVLEGIVADWNVLADVYDLSLAAGDIVLEANGISGDAKSMVKAIDSASAWAFKAVHVNRIWNARHVGMSHILGAIDSPILSSAGGDSTPRAGNGDSTEWVTLSM